MGLLASVIVLAVLVFEWTTAAAFSPLRVSAFNIRVFGITKITRDDVRDTLVKVVNRYDIILIQEIRDVSGTAIKRLLAETNKFAANHNYGYDMVISGRLGRTVSKEQYAFLYRKDLVSVKSQYIYQDSKDVFEREPFIVRFSVPNSAVNDMAFVAIHTKPSAATQEIDNLVDVYDDVVQRWKMDNVVIMGDLNAACDYVKDTEWKNIRLANDKRFWWLIDDCQDTTIKGSRCAYDRFIATGTELLSAIVINSAGIFDFKTAYNLDEKQAEEVSDHFPIEFHIKGKAWQHVAEEMDYIVTSSLPSVTKNDVHVLRKSRILNLGYTVWSLYENTGGIATITLTKTINGIKSAIATVEELRSNFPKLVTVSQSQVAQYYLSKFDTIPNKPQYQVLTEYPGRFLVNGIKIKIQLNCDVQVKPVTCRLILRKEI